MTDHHGLHVEVQPKDIVVTLPGTSYTVAYYKPEKSAQLRVWSYTAATEPDAPMTQAEFQARAWRLANDKARELGWIL
jgi:hypothetical protein